VTSTRVSAFVATLVLGGALVASPASAQTRPSVSVGIGYQLLHIPDETYPFGINVDVNAPFGDAGLSWVADIGYARDQQDIAGFSGLLEFWSFGGGVRLTGGSSFSGLRPYVQFVVGGAHTNAHLRTVGTTIFRDADTVFMLQPGFGVSTAGPVGVFAQFDYRRAFFDNGTGTGENEFRGVVGVRLGASR